MKQWWKQAGQRRAFMALLLAAVVFRAVVPVGYMPASDADAGFRLVLCSGLVLESGATDHGHEGTGSSGVAHLPCTYAAAGPAPLLAFLTLVVAVPAATTPVIPADVVAIAATALVRAQSPRAPPGIPNA